MSYSVIFKTMDFLSFLVCSKILLVWEGDLAQGQMNFNYLGNHTQV